MGFIFVIIVLGFAGLVWLGRAKRLGQLPKGPFLHQGRAISAIGALAAIAIGGLMVFRGILWGGILIFIGLSGLGGLKANWRPQFKPKANAYDKRTQEALNALGLTILSDKSSIEAAWRERMKTAHPDQGGSTQAAAQLNAARDHLLALVDKKT